MCELCCVFETKVLCLQIFWIIIMAAANDHVVDNFDKDLDEEEVRLYAILLAFDDGTLDEEEFLVLYFKGKNINKENPTFQYWKYEFNFESMTDDECKSEFRFRKSDIPRPCASLRLDDVVVTYNRYVVEAVCILLKRLAYPCRYSDMVARFGRPVPTLSNILNHMVNLIYQRFHHLLFSLEQSLHRLANSLHTPFPNLLGLLSFPVLFIIFTFFFNAFHDLDVSLPLLQIIQ